MGPSSSRTIGDRNAGQKSDLMSLVAPRFPASSDAFVKLEEVVVLRECPRRIRLDVNAVHAELACGFDVAFEVVEENRMLGRNAAEHLERLLENARVGLAIAHLARVDDEVEELVHRNQRAPRIAELPHVVGDDRARDASLAQSARAFEKTFARTGRTSERGEHAEKIRVEAVLTTE